MSFISPMIGDYKYNASNTYDGLNGWLLCDGRDISRTTYAALFAKIGTSFGVGDGSTTFAIPEGAGNVFAVPGNGFTLGQTTGVVNSSATIAQANLPDYTLPISQLDHTHPITDVQHDHGYANLLEQTHYMTQGSNYECPIMPFTPGTTESSYTGITITNGSQANITVNLGGGSTPLSMNVMQPTLVGGYLYIYAGA